MTGFQWFPMGKFARAKLQDETSLNVWSFLVFDPWAVHPGPSLWEVQHATKTFADPRRMHIKVSWQLSWLHIKDHQNIVRSAPKNQSEICRRALRGSRFFWSLRSAGENLKWRLHQITVFHRISQCFWHFHFVVVWPFEWARQNTSKQKCFMSTDSTEICGQEEATMRMRTFLNSAPRQTRHIVQLFI